MLKKKKDPEMKFGEVYTPFRGGKSRQKFKIGDVLSDKIEKIRLRTVHPFVQTEAHQLKSEQYSNRTKSYKNKIKTEVISWFRQGMW